MYMHIHLYIYTLIYIYLFYLYKHIYMYTYINIICTYICVYIQKSSRHFAFTILISMSMTILSFISSIARLDVIHSH